jgi:hypothetical protein
MKKENDNTIVETTEVATTQTTAVSAEVSTSRRGFENVDMASITMPRAKLLQSNSPEVSDTDLNLRAGDVIHALTMDKLPEKFIPIMFLPDTNILFVPREQVKKQAMQDKLGLSAEELSNTTIVCRAKEGKFGNKFGSCAKCGLCKFNETTNEKPLCTSSINVLILPIGEEMPVVLQFSNTSKKHGVKFKNTTLFKSGDLYSNAYKLMSERKTNNGNSWFEMSVKPAGKPDDEALARAEATYNQFKNLIVDFDDEEEVGTGSNNSEY